jgi:hypothetical protein
MSVITFIFLCYKMLTLYSFVTYHIRFARSTKKWRGC